LGLLENDDVAKLASAKDDEFETRNIEGEHSAVAKSRGILIRMNSFGAFFLV